MTSDAAPPPRSKLYLYALAPGDVPCPAGNIGLEDAPLRRVEMDGFTAVTSPLAAARLRPERRHLAAHQAVLQALMQHATVLPVSFGVVFRSAGELRRVLEAEAESIRAQLARVQGHAELSLRVSWDVENIFQHFIETDAGLRAARDQMVAQGSPHTAKVAVGQLFESLLTRRREDVLRRVLGALEPAAAETAVEPPRTEREVLRLAALVERPSIAGFEERLGQAAAEFDASFRFEYSGPWAPHTFVRLELNRAGEAGAD